MDEVPARETTRPCLIDMRGLGLWVRLSPLIEADAILTIWRPPLG